MSFRPTGPALNRERHLNPQTREWYSNLPIQEDPDYVVFFNDFLSVLDYSTSNSTLTAVGSGTAAVNTTSNQVNGILLLTNSAADDDSLNYQLKNESWKIVAGKKLWFEAGVAISDATQSDFYLGLSITDTTSADASDFIGFTKVDGSTAIGTKSVKNSAGSTSAAVATMDTSQHKYGFYWDGVDTLRFFFDRQKVATVNTFGTNIVDDEDLTVSFLIQNGEAVAKTASVDYFYVAKQR